jgi:transposase
MERYTRSAVERAMKVQEVILQAMNGRMKWIEAADVLGVSPRTVRRWRWRMEHYGLGRLLDGRCAVPSCRRTPRTEVEEILQLYRDRYAGFNVRHFVEVAQREHGLRRSYTLVKQLLQGAGLVRKRRPRGRHRQRRERRACFGMMLHIDGSRHAWLRLAPAERHSLIAVVDDATGQLLYARLEAAESTETVLRALRQVFSRHGLPQQIYTDRASWAACTRRAGSRPRADRPTQVERALEALGIEHLHAYSPQARGRSERVNRTLQDRLVNELRVAGARTSAEANRYLEEFLPRYNQRFAVAPADPQTGFAPLHGVDLEQFLCFEGRRCVGRDNTVVLGRTILQIPRQPGRASCQGLKVVVRRHLDGGYSVLRGNRMLARYDAQGRCCASAA